MSTPPEQEGYIIEFHIVGNSVKVTAIDPESAREVSIVGAPSAGREDLALLAVRKLKYMMEKDER